MSKNLLIVESPAKAKTIEKYLGSDYEVLSSMGHIRDIPKKGIGIDIDKDFQPEYEINPDKKDTIKKLKITAKNKEVWLATDEDREGEAISWHLCHVLGLDPKKVKRITFNEITKEALENSVKNPRLIDLNLVDAQQARRVLDRLVGYELSPVLWKTIKTGLSAGRVQSAAVRLVVDRERDIINFEEASSYKLIAELKSNDGEQFSAELDENSKDEKSAEAVLNKLKGKKFIVDSVINKPGIKSSPAPFTTSTLQQAAASRLGYSVKQTMVLAQKLYEAGHISYMRTDSVNLSKSAIEQAKQTIIKNYGKEYFAEKHYKNKNSSAQEAHEAIRPTDFKFENAGSDEKQVKLYSLIRSRALASQMSNAKIEKTTINLLPVGLDLKFSAKGEVVIFPGFLSAYGDKQYRDKLLPKLNQSDVLECEQITASEVFTKPPSRYSEASLVKKLESEGIGRPSTYAPIISTIQARGYVEKSNGEGRERKSKVLTLRSAQITQSENIERVDTDRSRLIPTDIGVVVSDFLEKHFSKIVDYKFSATIEKDFDNIASGNLKWQDMIGKFYYPFHKDIEGSSNIKRIEQGRILGDDPKSKKPVIARVGKYGPMIQIGKTDEEEKVLFAPMPPGRRISDVTLEEALKMFDLPRKLGNYEDGNDIVVTTGRFGPYLKVGAMNISIGEKDPFTISLDEADDLIKEHLDKLSKKIIKEFKKEDIKVLNGRFGPYISDGKKNFKIPKEIDASKISLSECKEIIEKRLKKAK